MNRLKELRKDRCLTQEQLADIIGVSAPTIYHWEHEKRQIRRKYLEQLADYFNCSIDYLVYSTGKRYVKPEELEELEEIKDLIEWFNFKANQIIKRYNTK